MRSLSKLMLLALVLATDAFLPKICKEPEPKPDWDGDKPWFCGTFDCPYYTVEEHDGYELRTYPSESHWATISIKTRSKNSADWQLRQLDSRLYNYSLGNNVAKENIPLALPRMTEVKKLPCNRLEITRMFYLPIDDPPRPCDSEIRLETRPSKNVYARAFPQLHRASDTDCEENLDSAMERIEDPCSYNDKNYFRTSYQDPRRPGLKQYEVWMDQVEHLEIKLPSSCNLLS